MKQRKKLVTIIVPAYNEEKNVRPFHVALVKVLRGIKDLDFRILFVNDGSSDKTLDVIRQLMKTDQRVDVIDFVRNFGKEIATTAGLNHAAGDASIMIDADLQHPVELIPEFIAKWQKGAEVVIGQRIESDGQNWFLRLRSGVFYWIFNKISDTTIVSGTTDYQLLDRAVVDEFNRFTEHARMTRGLIRWLGFPAEYIQFKANERAHGSANYSTFKLIRLAANSFVSLSLFPLKLAGYLGMFISSISGLLGVYMYLDRYILRDPFSFSFTGTAFLAVLIIFLVGIILTSLGLIALYIGNIHDDVANRPLYVMRRPRR